MMNNKWLAVFGVALAAFAVIVALGNATGLLDDSIFEVHLHAIDVPADGEVASYDAASGGFEWIAAGGGGGTHPITTGDISNGVVDSAVILDNSILEIDLKSVDAATDEECLTYESTVGDFEWQSCGALVDIGADDWTSGLHSFPGLWPVSQNSEQFSANFLSHWQTTVLEGVTISELVLEIITADVTSTNARVCVYEADTAFTLGALVIEETFDATTTGKKTMTINSGTPYTLVPGNYVIVLGADKVLLLRTLNVVRLRQALNTSLGASAYMKTQWVAGAAEISGGCADPGTAPTGRTNNSTPPEIPVWVTISTP